MTDYCKFYQSGPLRVPGFGVPLPPLLRRQADTEKFLAGAVQRLTNRIGQQVENEKGVDVP